MSSECIDTICTIISTLCTVTSILCIFAGGVFSYWQWKKSNMLKRAEYIESLEEKMRSDAAIIKCFKIIEYDESWYSEDFHHSEFEQEMDRYLSFLTYICYLYEEKIIEDTEFEFLKYKVDRTLTNDQVLDYLHNIYLFSKDNNNKCSFSYLINYAKKYDYLDADFFKPVPSNSKKYHTYLNFNKKK